MFTMPEVRVGEPLSCGSLGVFPLFSERSLFPDRTLDYLLPNEAMEGGTVVVTEVSEAGSVPELRVRNDGDLPVSDAGRNGASRRQAVPGAQYDRPAWRQERDPDSGVVR